MSQFLQDPLNIAKKLTELANNLEKKIILEQLKNDINTQINNLHNNIPPVCVPSNQSRNNSSDIFWTSSLRN